MSSSAVAGAPAAPRRVVQRRWGPAVLSTLAGVLFVWSVATVWAADTGFDGGPAAETLVAALMTLPLAVATRWPLPAALLVCTGAGLDYWLGGGLGQAWFAMLVAVFVVGERAGVLARAIAMVVVAGLALAVDLPRLRAGAPLDEVLPGWFVIAAVYGLGRWVASRRADQARLHERALAAESDRDEATRAALAHERALIARELHDLVGHSLSVMVLQAQGGQRVVHADPDAAAAALETIEGLGREGMSELRRLLGIMAPEAGDAGRQEDAAGVPSIAGLGVLVDRVRAAGLPVELSVELSAEPSAEGAARDGAVSADPAGGGDVRTGPLPAALELTAYRIVQEALTNSLRHAGPATARVRVARQPDALEVSVADTGSGAAAPSRFGGRGLIGMRERVALFGGTLTAGGRAGGGFEVVARLPLEHS
ncbi:sensor histidine kinase [Knoellia sp. CPCC 206450]|uniref:sensor histidine kinase n=1 Tax=Knoellia tibetensis TaxID=3404798 RepID=UPI003B436566